MGKATIVPEDLRRERVVTLFTRDELDRIDAFRDVLRASQKIAFRSEMFRHAILSQVQRWERNQK